MCVCVCVSVCVSHQVGPSSPVEEESIWVNFQGYQSRGPAIGLLDNKRNGDVREMNTTTIFSSASNRLQVERKCSDDLSSSAAISSTPKCQNNVYSGEFGLKMF